MEFIGSCSQIYISVVEVVNNQQPVGILLYRRCHLRVDQYHFSIHFYFFRVIIRHDTSTLSRRGGGMMDFLIRMHLLLIDRCTS